MAKKKRPSSDGFGGKKLLGPAVKIFPKIVGFPPKSSILIGFSIIFIIHFGVSLFFGNIQK